MRTAIDANVISALWSKEPSAERAAELLGGAKRSGGLVMCGAVYAELLAYPRMNEKDLDAFLEKTGVVVDFDLGKGGWIEAGRRFARYAARRRSSGVEGPKRLLADFIVGAHALTQADRLMTMDAGRYKQDFPELKLI